MTMHAAHTFSAIRAEAQNNNDTTTTTTLNMLRTGLATHSNDTGRATTEVVHNNIICDMCKSTVVGIRHKCLDCPGTTCSSEGLYPCSSNVFISDYDLCDRCYPSAPVTHSVDHQFFDIETPGRVIVHTIFEGDRDNERRNNPTNNSEPSTTTQTRAIHNASCNLCESRIHGARYVSCTPALFI